MTQKKFPCILMRGGTSKGPFFLARDLPRDKKSLAKILIKIINAGHPLNIDGIGGGNAVTTKVAILSPSQHKWAQVDYLFAQVAVDKKSVDFSPTCGNMLAAVGPAAIEMGLVKCVQNKTQVKIRSKNTGALVTAIVQTKNNKVIYDGTTKISGVNGRAAPIVLNFQNIIGSKTKKLFPTTKPQNKIENVSVTCIDVAMPMVIGMAKDFGISGYETQNELNANKKLFEKIERVRRRAGKLMGLGDVKKSVIPKFALLARAKKNGTLTARYFMPWRAHPSYAVTGAICTGACVIAKNTIFENIGKTASKKITIEHPSGTMDVVFQMNGEEIIEAGVIRSARKLFVGEVFAAT